MVHLICFLLLFLIRGRTEGTEGACSVSPFAVGFLLSLCSCCPYSLAIHFVNKQSACNYFFLISAMSDFSRKAKEEQSACRINPFYTQVCNTSFNALFQQSCLQSLPFIYHSHCRVSSSFPVQLLE